jgi:hypothetical protein
VTTLQWIGLAFLIVATLGGAAFAGRQGLATWRALRSLQRTLEPALAEVTARAATIEPRAAKASGASARLQEATARLQRSLAVMKVIVDATAEVRSALRLLALLRA